MLPVITMEKALTSLERKNNHKDFLQKIKKERENTKNVLQDIKKRCN
jgi:hypothetical protein